MLLVREIFHCKSGKVRALVEKFLAMNTLSATAGMPPMRIMTDFCAERYWTLVGEIEVESLEAFERMMQGGGTSKEAMQQMETIMKDYHELVESGRREIYKIEA